MITAGVDLAAEPTKTAFARIEWGTSSAVLSHPQVGVSDQQIVEWSQDAKTVGIDCAFGWPIDFVEFVTAHERGEMSPRTSSGKDWRRRLAYRHTDRAVRELTGRWPLSVSTDRLGLTAMHCAELLADFEQAGDAVHRSGRGRLVEVYPAAALRVWGVAVQGYKTQPDARGPAAEALLSRISWLDVSKAQRSLLSRSDDALDAVVACLNARAHALGRTSPVPDHLRAVADIEGWIAVPGCELGHLCPQSWLSTQPTTVDRRAL